VDSALGAQDAVLVPFGVAHKSTKSALQRKADEINPSISQQLYEMVL
jgi:hypothetical protein